MKSTAGRWIRKADFMQTASKNLCRKLSNAFLRSEKFTIRERQLEKERISLEFWLLQSDVVDVVGDNLSTGKSRQVVKVTEISWNIVR